MIDDTAIGLLREVAIGSGLEREGQDVRVLVTGCAYSCCGKGWRRRDGYRQKYIGYIDNLQMPEGEAAGTFMLYAKRLQAVVAVRFFEVEEVVVAGASWPAHW